MTARRIRAVFAFVLLAGVLGICPAMTVKTVLAEESLAETDMVAVEDSAADDSATGEDSAVFDPASYLNYTWDFDAVSSVSTDEGYTYVQDTDALMAFNYDEYKAVWNTDFGIQTSTYYEHTGLYGTDRHELTYAEGDLALCFETLVQLPVTLDESGDLGNPQAMCVSSDGSLIYIAYPYGHGYGPHVQGRIVKYDLDALRELGATEDDMSTFSLGVKNGVSQWLECMTIGPVIAMGHGQCMALDPSTDELWLSTRAKSTYSDLTRIDTETLEPVRQIQFSVGTIEFGSVLAFDECGNFYYVKRAAVMWGSSPVGALRIYQGRISTDEDKVLIRMLPESVANPASTMLQAVAWDTTSDTLYVVGDSALLSVDMRSAVQGTLTAEGSKTELLSPIREFEGMAFDAEGTIYLLANRQAEILTARQDQ